MKEVKCSRFISHHFPMLTPEKAREQVLSPEERCRIVQGLIAQKVIDILDRHILVAAGSNDNQVNVTLGAKDCRDPDTNIRQYL